MIGNINNQNRRLEILATVIESHIKTGDAVSSEDICRHFECSSATIRNIMSELEENGYFTHKHTSGGRLPTDKGYRYYVDMLLSQIDLVENEKERINKEYKRQLNRLEDVLEKTTEVLFNFTHCAGIVSFLNSDSRIFYNGASFITEYPELGNIKKMRNILKALEEKKRLLDIINCNLEKKLNIYIGEELSCTEIADCSLVVSTYDFQNRPFGKIAVLGPRSMNYNQVIPTLEYVSELVSKALRGR